MLSCTLTPVHFQIIWRGLSVDETSVGPEVIHFGVSYRSVVTKSRPFSTPDPSLSCPHTSVHHAQKGRETFSFPEALLLLVNTKNHNLWRVQRDSGSEWLCKHNRLRPFVRLHSEHALSDGKSVNRRLPVLDLTRGCDSWCWLIGARPLGTGMGSRMSLG